MKFNGINHLAMATGDMDATIRFWRDLLAIIGILLSQVDVIQRAHEGRQLGFSYTSGKGHLFTYADFCIIAAGGV